jgi:2-methylisocitrate lyase-like PEP mutase family enzyme
MGKLQDLFTQVRRAQGSGGIGFIGKNKSITKPRAAALVVALNDFDAGKAETAVKAGADGLLFSWDGDEDTSELETLQKTIEAAQTGNENLICGLEISGGWDKLERENVEHLKELGLNYVVIPLQAPARLLAFKIKDLELAVSVPMREGDMYPLFIRNLTAFDNIAAVRLNFGLSGEVSAMSIEDVLHYRAVREAVRFPALLNVTENISEDDAFTLMTLGVQAVILTASGTADKMTGQIQSLREVLEKVHQDEKESSTASGRG